MNKTIKILLIATIVVLITGTFIFNPLLKWVFGIPNQNSIYDSNKAIASDADSYSYVTRYGGVKDNKAELSFKLTGMDTLWKLDSDQLKEVTLKYDIEMQRGQFKIVHVTPDKEVITLLEGSGEGEIDFTIEPGKNSIKMVGRKTEVQLKLELIQ